MSILATLVAVLRDFLEAQRRRHELNLNRLDVTGLDVIGLDALAVRRPLRWHRDRLVGDRLPDAWA